MNQIPDLNLFMMCQKLNLHALSEMPAGYHVRNCQEKELDIWKAMPFDTQELANQYYDYMTQYFNSVNATKRELFFQKCLFVCDENDKPVGTCFAWSAYEKITTIHWLKILKDYEGKGLGRALLSIVIDLLLPLDEMGEINPKDTGEVAYMLGNGTVKARADKTGGARDKAKFKCIFLSTGETSLAQHMLSVQLALSKSAARKKHASSNSIG